ncbi:MAG: complex I NDUFA9 subunit family protein [Proteobacteria bacterium]|nr:complex I NDUFA9 subunit family protein [Pseudomonadota bacterium]
MRIESVGIFGASGFVGTRLANQLAAQGVALRVFTRSRNTARHLWQLPNCEVIETDIFDAAGLSKYVAGCDAVINLVGILNEKGDDGTGFRRVHTELTRTIIKVCFNTGVQRYIHMSALGADAFAPSYYLRTKGEAENAVMAAHDEGLQTTVFRPSVVFGPGDSFYNRFANLLKISPVIFPLACAKSKFQPVYVGDVCRAIIASLGDQSTFGNRYDLGGPEQKTLREIIDYVAELTGRHRMVIPLGAFLSKVQANVFEYFLGKPFSRDNLRSASEDSVCQGENGLVTLGIHPTSVNEIVPTYLGGKFERRRFYNFRTTARRGR